MGSVLACATQIRRPTNPIGVVHCSGGTARRVRQPGRTPLGHFRPCQRRHVRSGPRGLKPFTRPVLRTHASVTVVHGTRGLPTGRDRHPRSGRHFGPGGRDRTRRWDAAYVPSADFAGPSRVGRHLRHCRRQQRTGNCRGLLDAARCPAGGLVGCGHECGRARHAPELDFVQSPTETRCYISRIPAEARALLQAVPSHWGLEDPLTGSRTWLSGRTRAASAPATPCRYCGAWPSIGCAGRPPPSASRRAGTTGICSRSC